MLLSSLSLVVFGEEGVAKGEAVTGQLHKSGV